MAVDAVLLLRVSLACVTAHLIAIASTACANLRKMTQLTSHTCTLGSQSSNHGNSLCGGACQLEIISAPNEDVAALTINNF